MHAGTIRSASLSSTSSVVIPHNEQTVFVTKKLFEVSPNTHSMTLSSSSSSSARHPPSYFQAFPLDENYLFVVCSSEKSTRDGGSKVFLVQLSSGNVLKSHCSRLSLAFITGCVCGDAAVVQPRPLKSAGSQKRIVVHSSSSSSAASPARERNSILHQSETSDAVESEENVARSLSFKEDTTRLSTNGMHLFLMADAAKHAIWAVEVDTTSMQARAISPPQFWRLREDEKNAAHRTEESNPQRIKKSTPKPLVGGTCGFLDGVFQVARFAAPSAMCWRMDRESDATPTSQKCEKEKKQAQSCWDVLFVSDHGNHAIRYVNFRTKIVRTVAGLDGVSGYRDGSYRVAQLQECTAMVWCSLGLVFIDGPNGTIRLITELEKRETRKEKKEGNKKHAKQMQNVHTDSSSSSSFDANANASVVLHRPVPQVWTIAGGLYNNAGPYIDAVEVRRASLGLPTALAVTPDGSGVLFSDSKHSALRLVSKHGVKTFVAGCSFPDPHILPRGLLACTHVAVCRLYVPNAGPRLGYIVCSATHQTVSLLLPCCNVDEQERVCRAFDMNPPTVISIVASMHVKVDDGAWHRYIHRRGKSGMFNGKEGLDHTVQRRQLPHVVGRHSLWKHGDRKKTCKRSFRHCCLSLIDPVISQIDATEGRNLTAAKQQIFSIYRYYTENATPFNKNFGLIGSCKGDEKYTMTLLQFLWFISHTEYFTPISSELLTTNCISVSSTAPLLAVSESQDRFPWNLQDWRVVAHILFLSGVKHELDINHRMHFNDFCRVIIFLYCWKQQRHASSGEARPGDPLRLLDFSLEALTTDEVVAALEDAVYRVERTNAFLSSQTPRAMHIERVEYYHKNKDLTDTDALFRVLLNNRFQFEKLFSLYSTRTSLLYSFARNESNCMCATPTELQMALRGLHHLSHTCVHFIEIVPYHRFRSLFYAVDVFPTLVNELLLQRAFVEAMLTPLLHSLHLDTIANTTAVPQHDEERTTSCILTPDALKAYTRGRAALPFIPFIEAFVRVALITFSLCNEHDKRLYALPSQKLEALMAWINRALEMALAQRRTRTATSSFNTCNERKNRTLSRMPFVIETPPVFSEPFMFHLTYPKDTLIKITDTAVTAASVTEEEQEENTETP